MQVCSGMYSKKDWNGKVDPFISFNLKSISNYNEKQNHDVSVIIFDFQDYPHIGKLREDTKEYYLICDEEAIAHDMCNATQINQFLIEPEVYDPLTDTNKTANAEILTFYQDHTGLYEYKYKVEKSGYYCALTYSNNGNLKYNAVVNFRNAFGQLPASEVNNLALYGLLAVFYAVGCCLYGFAFWKHKHELLPLQKYLLAFYGFLIFENVLSLSLTMQYLQEQKQMVKLNMYNNLLKIITLSLVAVMFGTLMTSIMLLGMSAVEMVEKNWRYRFFFTDFWSSLVYFVVFVLISFIWRPTSTSYMLALSQQLPTDPDNIADFDLDDMSSINNEQTFRNNNASKPSSNEANNPFGDSNEIDFNLSDDEQNHI
ncbi:unnamed protein product [Hanseniaspora opuntiae]